MCDSVAIPDDEEAHIQLLLKSNALNKAGSLFKAGVQVCNSKVLLEAAKRKNELERLTKEKKALADRDNKQNEGLKAV